jgi:hypothetical protein
VARFKGAGHSARYLLLRDQRAECSRARAGGYPQDLDKDREKAVASARSMPHAAGDADPADRCHPSAFFRRAAFFARFALGFGSSAGSSSSPASEASGGAASAPARSRFKASSCASNAAGVDMSHNVR